MSNGTNNPRATTFDLLQNPTLNQTQVPLEVQTNFIVPQEHSDLQAPIEMTITKHFAKLTFKSPMGTARKMSSPQVLECPKRIISNLGLTPIIEDFNDLKLGSTDKKVKDDFKVVPQHQLLAEDFGEDADDTQRLHLGRKSEIVKNLEN